LQINELDKALIYTHQALEIFNNSVEKNDFSMAPSYQRLGNIYLQKKEYIKASEAYFNALKIVEKINKNSKETAICYRDIAILYYNSGNPDKALIFIKKSINILEKNKEKLYFEVLKLLDAINYYLGVLK